MKHWSLTTLREKLVKIGAKVTRHSKYVTKARPRDFSGHDSDNGNPEFARCRRWHVPESESGARAA